MPPRSDQLPALTYSSTQLIAHRMTFSGSTCSNFWPAGPGTRMVAPSSTLLAQRPGCGLSCPSSVNLLHLWVQWLSLLIWLQYLAKIPLKMIHLSIHFSYNKTMKLLGEQLCKDEKVNWDSGAPLSHLPFGMKTSSEGGQKITAVLQKEGVAPYTLPSPTRSSLLKFKRQSNQTTSPATFNRRERRRTLKISKAETMTTTPYVQMCSRASPHKTHE